MAAKREQIIWSNLWQLCEKLERSYTLKSLLSAGVLLISKLSAQKREEAVEEARLYKENQIPSEQTDSASIDNTISYIKKLALTEAGYNTEIAVLGKEDKRRLAELRNILGVKEQTKKRNRKHG